MHLRAVEGRSSYRPNVERHKVLYLYSPLRNSKVLFARRTLIAGERPKPGISSGAVLPDTAFRSIPIQI